MNNEIRNSRDGRDGGDRFAHDVGNNEVRNGWRSRLFRVDSSNRVGFAKGLTIAAGLIIYALAARAFSFEDPFKD